MPHVGVDYVSGPSYQASPWAAAGVPAVGVVQGGV